MQYTENYGLKKPAAADRFLVSDMNENLDLLDGLFGGIRFAEPMTQAQYDAMERHDAKTLYFVLEVSE